MYIVYLIAIFHSKTILIGDKDYMYYYVAKHPFS